LWTDDHIEDDNYSVGLVVQFFLLNKIPRFEFIQGSDEIAKRVGWARIREAAVSNFGLSIGML
jgi:hypothetical protein